MDPEFQRAMIWIIGVFGAIALIATTALFFGFRALEKPGSRKALVILSACVAFIFLVCLGLFVWSVAAAR